MSASLLLGLVVGFVVGNVLGLAFRAWLFARFRP